MASCDSGAKERGGMSSNVRRADAGDILEGAYHELLDDLKNRIRNARVRAALNVNRELTQLYWQIGQAILERQAEEGRGAKVIERLADDLRREFTDMKGLSRANLFCMRAFAEAYPNEEIVQQLAAQMPWWHDVVITELEDPKLREWYIRACIESGWGGAVFPDSLKDSLTSVEKLEAELRTNLKEVGYGE